MATQATGEQKGVLDALKEKIFGCMLTTNRRSVATNLAIDEKKYDDICYRFLQAKEKKEDNQFAFGHRTMMSLFSFVFMLLAHEPVASGTLAVTGTVWGLLAIPSHRNTILYGDLVEKCHEAIKDPDGLPETFDQDFAKYMNSVTLSTDVLLKLLQKFENAEIAAPALYAKIDEHLQDPHHDDRHRMLRMWLEKLFGIDSRTSIEELRNKQMKKLE